MRFATALCLCLLVSPAPPALAQVCTGSTGAVGEWNVPRDRANSRFYPDHFASQGVIRPALSMRGFDNTQTGPSAGHHT